MHPGKAPIPHYWGFAEAFPARHKGRGGPSGRRFARNRTLHR
jgi:hypothetical protein